VALERLAAFYNQTGENDKAVQVEETIYNANPNNLRAMLDLARLYALKNAPKAFEMAKNAYKVAPQDPAVSALLGRLAYQAGDYKWALSLLQETAPAQPKNPDLAFDLARAAYSMGKVADARSACQKALDLGLNAAQAGPARQWLELMAAVEPAASLQTAGPLSESILKTDSNNVPALMVVARVAEEQGNREAAGQDYERILNLFPDFAPAQKKLALIYARNPQRIQEAKALAVKARQSLPEDAELAELLGIVLCQQGDYPQAVNYLKVSLPNRPSDPELFYYLGLAQYHLKNLADSKTSLRKALDLKLSDPLAAEARRMLQAK
jgi:tetratricopeptide (TPR) repeat protein